MSAAGALREGLRVTVTRIAQEPPVDLLDWAEPARSFSFVVTGPPVPCARVRVVHRPGKKTTATTPDKTRAYERLVGMVALSKRPPSWSLDGAAYGILLNVYRAERRGDADNFLKAVVDALTGVAWKDDASVLRMTVRLFEDHAQPRIHATVELIG